MDVAPPGLVGFLPAAGRGVRFGDSGYAKELFPLLRESEGVLELWPIGELALQAIRDAGASRCVTVVSPEKLEIVRILGPSQRGMPLGYVLQAEPRGIPDAVMCARPWLGEADVLFALPDTVFLPADALAEVQRQRLASGADVVLGVFPTDEPERLGPVEMDPSGRVRHIHDKPQVPPSPNTWGIASWSGRFTAFCCEWEGKRARDREGAIGHVFEAAREAGLDVRAVYFAGGRFLDIGTPQGLRAALAALVTHGVLIPEQAAVRSARGKGV